MARAIASTSLVWKDEAGKELVQYNRAEEKAVIVPQRCDYDQLLALAEACTAAAQVMQEAKRQEQRPATK